MTPWGRRPSLATRVTLALVLLALANAVYSAWDMGWTYDEPFFLAWNERLLLTGSAARDSQHYNSKTPVLVPNVVLRRAVARATSSEPALRFAARLPTVGWLALLLGTVFLVGRRWLGTPAALVATSAAALDPNLVAHGSLVTVDVAYTLATLLTVAAALAFAERASLPRAAGLGAALGLALTAKFSAVLLLPALLPLPWFARRQERRLSRWLLGALVVALVAALTISAAYFFHDVGRPLGRAWASAALKAVGHALPGLRLPLPRGFLSGLDASLAAERHDWNIVLLDHCYPRGIWFYFVVLWALKTPLLLAAAEAYGLWRALRTRLAPKPRVSGLLVLVLLVHLAYFSFVFQTQVGYRYVLMCLPLAYLVAAAALVPLAERRLAPAVAAAVVLLGVAENAMYAGNPLAFSNAAVWPKRDAFRLMADSNLDWGQNDERIERWLAEHRQQVVHFNPNHLLPGRNLFDVNVVAGVDEFERHRFLRDHAEPVAHVRHTHLWFDVDDALFGRFLDAERRLAPAVDAGSLCPPDASGETVPASGRLNLFLPASRAPADTVACVSAPAGADLGVVALHGRLRLGRRPGPGPCRGDTIGEGQQSWWRLEPGVHALCLEALADARSGAAQPFEGWWVVADHPAALTLRDLAARIAALPPAHPIPERAAR